MFTAIGWIRKNMRLIGNPALAAALAEGYQVIPLFIVDPNSL